MIWSFKTGIIVVRWNISLIMMIVISQSRYLIRDYALQTILLTGSDGCEIHLLTVRNLKTPLTRRWPNYELDLSITAMNKLHCIENRCKKPCRAHIMKLFGMVRSELFNYYSLQTSIICFWKNGTLQTTFPIGRVKFIR